MIVILDFPLEDHQIIPIHNAILSNTRLHDIKFYQSRQEEMVKVTGGTHLQRADDIGDVAIKLVAGSVRTESWNRHLHSGSTLHLSSQTPSSTWLEEVVTKLPNLTRVLQVKVLGGLEYVTALLPYISNMELLDITSIMASETVPYLQVPTSLSRLWLSKITHCFFH